MKIDMLYRIVREDLSDGGVLNRCPSDLGTRAWGYMGDSILSRDKGKYQDPEVFGMLKEMIKRPVWLKGVLGRTVRDKIREWQGQILQSLVKQCYLKYGPKQGQARKVFITAL